MKIYVDIPADARRLGLVMCRVPFPVVVVVVMVVAAFVAGIATGQGKCDSAKEENDAQHIFDCMLHKEWFKYIVSKTLPVAKRGVAGGYYIVKV